jgi:hypothetical protein
VAGKLVSGAVVAALCLVGCGGSHKSAGTATRSSTPAAQTTPTATAQTRPEVPADRAIAAGALLTLADFPSGWQQRNQSRGEGTSTCPAVATARASLSGRATSPQFAQSSGDHVDDVVYVYPSASAAQTSFSRLSGATTRLCMANALRRHLPATAPSKQGGKITFGQPSTGALSISTPADQSAAGRITIPYTVGGLNTQVVVDVAFVRVDRGIQILVFLGSAGALDTTLEASLIHDAVGRLAAQLHVSTPGAETTTTTTATTTATTRKTTPTSTATTPGDTTTTPTTPSRTTPTPTTPTQAATTTTPATDTSTTPSGPQPSASAVAKAKQLLAVCRREQPNITLQELEREAASPLGIQC